MSDNVASTKELLEQEFIASKSLADEMFDKQDESREDGKPFSSDDESKLCVALAKIELIEKISSELNDNHLWIEQLRLREIHMASVKVDE